MNSSSEQNFSRIHNKTQISVTFKPQPKLRLTVFSSDAISIFNHADSDAVEL
jgi:hypothetical protein